MRTNLLAALFVLFYSTTSHSQTNFYFSDTTAQWNVLETQMGFCNCGWAQTYIFTAAGDTVISGTDYQRLFCSTQYPIHPMISERFYIRQDSLLKVRGRAHPDSPEYVIYDFGRQPGDTYSVGLQHGWPSTYQVHVDSVTTINWNGLRKVQYVSVNAIGVFNDVFVEGIGALHSFFLYPGAAWFAVDGPMVELLCFSENGQTIYRDTAYQTCVYDTVWGGIVEPQQGFIKVLPNPVTSNQFTVEAEENFPGGAVFKLMDLSGRIMLQKDLLGKVMHVELDNIGPGLYLYAVSTSDKKLATGKITVQ